jgi:hypothetical protein
MTRVSSRLRPGRSVLLGLFGLTLLGSTASAQVPEPKIPDITVRSGLLQRFAAPETTLPNDPYRDNFYGPRYGNYFKNADINVYSDGGLYGVPWKGTDTQSVYPFFYGTPGKSTITEESRPPRKASHRALRQLFHQRRPVGMYYDRGSYVPIYDLDSFAPGPGPDYFPFFFQGSRGG